LWGKLSNSTNPPYKTETVVPSRGKSRATGNVRAKRFKRRRSD